MKHPQAVITIVFVIILSNSALSQSRSEVIPVIGTNAHQLFESAESVPPGNSVRILSAFSPLGNSPNYLSGKIIFDINGFVSTGLLHDNSFGNPLGRMIQSNQLELRFQILEQRGYLPAVSLLYQTMFNKQEIFYDGNNLWSDNHSIYRNSTTPQLYNTTNSLFCIGLTSQISQRLNLSWSLGQREFIWEQANGLNVNGNSQSLISAQTSFRIHWSASAMYRMMENISIIGSVQTIPLLENYLSSFPIISTVGHRSALGVRYYLAEPINIELFDQVISGYSYINSYHYIRLGINAALSFE